MSITPTPDNVTAITRAAADGNAVIADALAAHRVVIFAQDGCDYCAIAERTLGGTLARIVRLPGCAAAATRAKAAVVTLRDGPSGIQAREALKRATRSHTLPAVFVDGVYVGGAEDTVRLARAGTLAEALRAIAGCSEK